MDSRYGVGKSDERFDPSFSAEIGTLMQVPKCIRVSGKLGLRTSAAFKNMYNMPLIRRQ
jgi:hypothetical protein